MRTSNTRYTVTVGVIYPSGNVKFYTRSARSRKEARADVDFYMDHLGKDCHIIVNGTYVFIGKSESMDTINGKVYGAYAERCTLIF